MLLVPAFKFAHEVYVLTPSQFRAGNNDHSQSIFSPLHSVNNLVIIVLGALGVAAVMVVLVWLKTKKPIQKAGVYIDRASGWAPDLMRVVFGASLIFSAWHGALFGPEMPLDAFPHAEALKFMLYVSGAALIAGIFTRLFGLIALAIWTYAAISRGWYMLNYANYVGEALALCLITFQNFSFDRLLFKLRRKKPNLSFFYKPELALPVTRILFGLSLLYAAISIKIFNSATSLDVVNRYHLTDYFPFDPMMIVLGAALVEILIALLYIFGFMQRLNSLLLIGFITLSLVYFKESVWPHYLLLALAAGIFLDKPDAWTVDNYLARKSKRRS